MDAGRRASFGVRPPPTHTDTHDDGKFSCLHTTGRFLEMRMMPPFRSRMLTSPLLPQTASLPPHLCARSAPQHSDACFGRSHRTTKSEAVLPCGRPHGLRGPVPPRREAGVRGAVRGPRPPVAAAESRAGGPLPSSGCGSLRFSRPATSRAGLRPPAWPERPFPPSLQGSAPWAPWAAPARHHLSSLSRPVSPPCLGPERPLGAPAGRRPRPRPPCLGAVFSPCLGATTTRAEWPARGAPRGAPGGPGLARGRGL